MSQVYDKILSITKSNSISNILFLNDFVISKDELIKLSDIIPNIYVSYHNLFQLRSTMVYLRKFRSIHVIDVRQIPLIDYQLVSTNKIDHAVNFILSKIKSINFLNVNDDVDEVPPGFIMSEQYGIFKRDENIIVETEALDNSKFRNELRSSLDNLGTNKNPKNLSLNNNSIIIKNITSSITKFNSNNEIKVNLNDGQLDVCCILELKKDYEKLLTVIKYLNNNYKNFKLFVFLVGKSILKYFKETDLNDINYILLKTENKDDIENCKRAFRIFSNGSIIINDFKKINSTKNILEVINENSVNITNI